HPRYLDHWGNINGDDLLKIREEFKKGLQDLFSIQNVDKLNTENLEEKLKDGIMILNNPDIKQFLENAFVIHDNEDTHLRIHQNRSLIFIELFGFGKTAKKTDKIDTIAKDLTALELFPYLTTIKVHDKAPYYMGSRMGRPEKAKERKLRPPVQSLFPIGHDAKLQRLFQNATQKPSIKIDICQKKCPKCNAITFLNLCPKCGTHTEIQKICPTCKGLYEKEENLCPKCQRTLLNSSVKKISFKTYFENALKNIHKTIPKIKGVKGMTSEYKIPEPLEKGILRAINKVWVYKDGTIRADATDIPLTHFNCKEIGVSVEKIKELGYDNDTYGNPIVDVSQIIELKVQDVLLTDHLGDYFVRVSKFVDDELEYIYNRPRFYNITEKNQLIGHYMAGLAPHTSAAIIGRLIGFTQAESGYAHPYWHAAKRRNSDGDEDGIMLLLECLLNFSKYYLPSSLGGKMDAPLVISLRLDPLEVDSESHNVDYGSRYPLQFYLDSQNYVKPIEMNDYMDIFRHHLRTEAQFEGSMFTHPTKSINLGPHKSAYTLFKTMNEKIESQLYLAKVISAVYEQEVARKVIGSHFAPDVLGNLRAFSTQTFRCIRCGEKFRRIPLSGKCTKCKGKLLLTVTSGGIKKYLPKAQELIEEFNLGAYTEQRWKIIEKNVKSLCDNPKIKQQTIASFFK
ncbi:MAG: DNA polymerase II large subunit, partial [Promethearchaeota archaeon]